MVELTTSQKSQVAPLSTWPRIIVWLFIVLFRFIYKKVLVCVEPKAELAIDYSSKLDELEILTSGVA